MNFAMDTSAAREKELHLRSGVILSIFIAITMVAAVIFGWVYSFGHSGTRTHSLQTASVSNNSSQRAVVSATSASPVAIPAPAVAQSQPVEIAPLAHSVARSTGQAHAAYMVQVAAVARRKDALSVVKSLRKHGFTAHLRTASSDKFFHVQIGPFTTQEQAQTMRHKVMTAGYRAIIKSK